MKKTFEKFAELNYNVDDFYAIRFMGEKVYLQGNATEKIIEKYQELGYNFQFDSVNRWLDSNLLTDDLTVVITLVLP
jgi:hypothetical protein